MHAYPNTHLTNDSKSAEVVSRLELLLFALFTLVFLVLAALLLVLVFLVLGVLALLLAVLAMLALPLQCDKVCVRAAKESRKVPEE